MMKIVVVGGSGFIGTRLVALLLRQGHRIVIYDLVPSATHPENVVLGDVRDTVALTRVLAGADCAVNLAAEHRDDVCPESRYFDVNVDGAKSFVAAAETNLLARIIFISSVAVYGLNQSGADESAHIAPVNAYGKSKAEAEEVYRRWCSADTARTLLILRPSVVFGEGNRGNVYNLIEQIRRHRLLMIGDGENRKSIAYVGNLVEFVCSGLDAGPGLHLYNYADKPDKSIAELVAVISTLLGHQRVPRYALPYWLALGIGWFCDGVAKITHKPLLISSARVRKFCADTRIDTAMLERTGYKASCTIDEGLARMVSAIESAHTD
jgi:nucleoside-diphosphate-sugar epimerase